MVSQMIKSFRGVFVILAVLLFVLPLSAQEEVAIANELPAQVMLEGFLYVHQDVNRCSAAALTMQLSHYEDASNLYQNMTARLNPYGADASVRIEEMAAAAQERGLNAIVRRGGTIDLMRELLAAGFPVLIENVYFDGPNGWQDWTSHNRVAVGYSDETQTFSFYDPLLGFDPNGFQIVEYTYEDIETRWKPFNRDYMVVYRDEEEATLREVLGEQWDPAANAQWVLQQAQREIDNGTADSFTYFNQGWGFLRLGQNEAAAAAFDTARSIGLPWRMLWYEFGPFEAYIAVGRYEDAIFLANQNINAAGNSISIEEWYYYAGLAYEGLGNIERALLNYEVAIFRNSNYTEVADRISAIYNS